MLTQHLTHPKHGIPKTYVVEIAGRLDEKQMAQLKAPTYLDGRKTSGLKVKSLRRSYDRSLLEITLQEGRNREIRRLLARLGHKVFKLKRTAIGSITDRGVKIGNFRTLNRNEVAALFKGPSAETAAETSVRSAPPTGKRKPVRKITRGTPRKKPPSSRGGTAKRPSPRRGGPAGKSSGQHSRRRRGSK